MRHPRRDASSMQPIRREVFMFQYLSALRGKVGASLLALSVTALSFAQFTPTYDVSPLVTEVQGEVTNVFTSLFPVLIAIIALLVGWKYVRRIGRGL